MDKDFLVLQCCDCAQFCVQATTKNRKWSCRVCGKKQSIVKVYGRGPQAAQVRAIAQRLSMAMGFIECHPTDAIPVAAEGFDADDAPAGVAWSEFVAESPAPPPPSHCEESDFTTVPEGARKAGSKRPRQGPSDAAGRTRASSNLMESSSAARKPGRGDVAFDPAARSTSAAPSWEERAAQRLPLLGAARATQRGPVSPARHLPSNTRDATASHRHRTEGLRGIGDVGLGQVQRFGVDSSTSAEWVHAIPEADSVEVSVVTSGAGNADAPAVSAAPSEPSAWDEFL